MFISIARKRFPVKIQAATDLPDRTLKATTPSTFARAAHQQLDKLAGVRYKKMQGNRKEQKTP